MLRVNRLNLVVTSTTKEELAYQLKSIVQLLKGKSIPLDYAKLAEELYRFNYPEQAADIKLSWGRDFYSEKYMMRFPDEDVSGLTLQQLRGREGSRIRKVYRQQSEKWNVEWNGRVYNHEDFQSSDPVNQALSAAHACLYGLAHAVICSMGCSPALGFVHIGHECSFVYDIADLYKAEVTIPISFEAAASVNDDISKFVRHRVRDEMVKAHMLERMVHDIKYLLMPEENPDDEKAMYLWNDKNEPLDYGKQYR